MRIVVEHGTAEVHYCYRWMGQVQLRTRQLRTRNHTTTATVAELRRDGACLSDGISVSTTLFRNCDNERYATATWTLHYHDIDRKDYVIIFKPGRG